MIKKHQINKFLIVQAKLSYYQSKLSSGLYNTQSKQILHENIKEVAGTKYYDIKNSSFIVIRQLNISLVNSLNG